MSFCLLIKRHLPLLTLHDLSTAFDTIDHDILYDRVSWSYGYFGTCLSWCRSYLSKRRHVVAIASHVSSTKGLHYWWYYGFQSGSSLPSPKVNNSGCPGRPIESAVGSHTEGLSELVDHLVQLFVPNIPSCIRDTQDILDKLYALCHLPVD